MLGREMNKSPDDNLELNVPLVGMRSLLFVLPDILQLHYVGRT